jgi:hypothetical protein
VNVVELALKIAREVEQGTESVSAGMLTQRLVSDEKVEPSVLAL